MPTYDIKCQSCGLEWQRFSTIAARYAPCETCGGAVEQTFKPSTTYHPFVEYYDFALGQHVTSLADRWRYMRGEVDLETGERRGRLEYRDKISRGELSARRDRLEQQHREQSRG